MMGMNKVLILAPLVLLSCKESCRVEDEEGEDAVILSFAETAEVAPTLEQDRLTYDKAMLAFEGGEVEVDLFELLSVDEPKGAEVNPDQLTYQRALEAVYEMDPTIVRQEAVVKLKRVALTKMIGNSFVKKEEGVWDWVPEPGYTMEEYEAAKGEYERERDLLKKLKEESLTLYRKE